MTATGPAPCTPPAAPPATETSRDHPPPSAINTNAPAHYRGVLVSVGGWGQAGGAGRGWHRPREPSGTYSNYLAPHSRSEKTTAPAWPSRWDTALIEWPCVSSPMDDLFLGASVKGTMPGFRDARSVRSQPHTSGGTTSCAALC